MAEVTRDPLLLQADLLLGEWAQWVRDDTWLGYPRRSVTEKANEGGIAAGSPRPPSDMPEEEALTDRAVAAMGNGKPRRVIKLYYEKRHAVEWIAAELKTSRYYAGIEIARAQRVFMHWRMAL